MTDATQLAQEGRQFWRRTFLSLLSGAWPVSIEQAREDADKALLEYQSRFEALQVGPSLPEILEMLKQRTYNLVVAYHDADQPQVHSHGDSERLHAIKEAIREHLGEPPARWSHAPLAAVWAG